MKLHTDSGDQFILSSDDIITSGKNIGKLLTDIIDDHTTDINDLKKYTKWLYKYGGTGSKGGSGSGGSSTYTKLQYQIKLAGMNVQNSNDYIILGDKIDNEKSVPLEIILTNANVNNQYIVRSLTVNGNSISISGRNSFTLDNDFKQIYSLNLSGQNKGTISILLRYTMQDGSTPQESISINYIKNAYSFTTNIVNNNGNTLFVNNESIFYTNSVNLESGVNLKINYDLQTDNDIIVRTSSDILNEQEFILNPVDRKEGYCIIPFNNEFVLNTEDLIGDYSIPLSFYSNGVRIYQETLNFTIVPADDVFIKIKPVISNAEIYKYHSNDNINILDEYDVYVKYYALYEKLNKNKTLSEEEKNDVISYFNIDTTEFNELTFFEDLTNVLYDALNNYKYYVFATGNIGFIISPYMPQHISESTLYYQLGKLNEITKEVDFDNEISQGYIQASQKNKQFNINIQDPGIYVISIYTGDTLNKIYYYFYTYNKDSTFNWYRSNIENIFNINPSYLHYFRNGNVTVSFNQYKNKQYIQQFASGNDITICNINNAINSNDTYDCFVSLGIQYSYINNANSYKSSNRTPIITINSNDNGNSLKLDIYQDKVIVGENLITLFLPKEQNYNVSNNSNYHLLSICKRYLYYNVTPYYEICVYLDGVLEGTMQAFSNSSAVWNSIILHKSNYGINLAEISYLPHTSEYYEDLSGNIVYLDDIAISEYHYKYANECNSASNAKDTASAVINALRKFKETDYGMIEVENYDIIKDISKTVNVPIIIFEYNEDGKNPEFVSNFLPPAGQEGRKQKWILQNIYYSPGKYELDLSKEDCKITIDGEGNWYIELQGSSTMQYFVKNLTLGIESNKSGHIYLFTPNFMYAEDNATNVNTAKKTYLPEKAFTLKADMVDSSHCNNTSIGEFVNNNTKKFDIQFDEHSVYHKYIKNCLTGFPILTFIKVNSYDTEGNKKENIYYLGIYNFNLGRDSYFNMGYYDPILLKQNNNGHIDNILKGCDGTKFVTMEFQLSNADDTDLRTRDSVIVAEIQGNSSYNDFSQYDKSILSPTSDRDDAAMFGDFVPKLTVNTQNKTLWHLQRLVEHVSKGGGYIFDYVLKKHLGVHSYEYSRYLEDDVNSSIFNSANQVPTYRLQFKRDALTQNDNLKYLINVNNTSTINNLITNNSNEYYTNLKNNLFELIFSSEVAGADKLKEPVIDYPSLAEYYTICMGFGLTDSVMKNLNIKTWNASWSDTYGADYNTSMENILGVSLHGKWFVAFYDMDTAFGRYNNGTYMDNSYFSFSDYWLSDETKLSEINIYRDFYPKENTNDPYVSSQKLKIHGYDSPSSYLFAVAKYAAIAVADAGTINPDGTALDSYSGDIPFAMYVPQNIWTKFRVLPNKVTSDSPYYGLHGIGELRNAQYFVDNYFSKSMNNIPEQLWNMNYRFKYLKRIKANSSADHGYSQTTEQNSGFSAKELQSFHGRGIYQVEDWLNYRLHMLDAYFNVDQTITPIKYLDYENTYEIVSVKDNNGNTVGYSWDDTSTFKKNDNNMPKWENTGYYDIVPKNSFDMLQSNEDVVILKDVFSQNELGNRYQNINLNVKALEYSPLVVMPYAKINQKKYLLIDPSKWYNINIQQTSSDVITFGGSGLWTEIENANSLIASNTLSIFSDKIQNLIVTSGICGTWNISEMKALNLISIKKDVKDTTSNFTGNIVIDSSSEEKHPDLTTIILDRTNISLSLTKGSIKYVTYTNSSGNLSLLDCSNLVSLNLTGSNIENCSILPGWTNKISIANSKIKYLSIAPKDENGENNELDISNISTLSSITISGNFKKIVISNCPQLTEIHIDRPESVESLSIKGCNTQFDDDSMIAPLSIYVTKMNEECTTIDNNETTINLNSFINLKELSFSSTFGFNILDIHELEGYLPSEYEGTIYESYKFIKLLSGAFENTKLKEIISGELYLMITSEGSNNSSKTATFANSYICSDNHKLNNYFFIPASVRSLSNLFANGAFTKRRGGIDLTYASILLGNRNNLGACRCIYENKDNIVDLSSMFLGQSIRCTEHNDNIQLTLSSFRNVSTIETMFEYCENTSYISKVLFDYNDSVLGSNVNSINIADFLKISKFELGAFSPIINKLTHFDFNSSGFELRQIYDENETLLNDNLDYEFPIVNLFEGITKNNILESISGINILQSISINWNGLFALEDNGTYVKRFPHLTVLNNSFSHQYASNVENAPHDTGFIGTPGIGLEYLNSNLDYYNTCNFSNKNEPINFSVLHNLNLRNKKNLCTKDAFIFYKTCTNEELISYINDYNSFSDASKFTTLDYAFSYLILDVPETDYHILRLDNALSKFKFTSMKYAFNSMSCTNDIPLIIDKDTLRSFTNVTLWNYAFAYVTLYKNLPLNLFNLHQTSTYNPSNYKHTISSMEGMFSNVKITNQTWFAHEDYDININDYNSPLDGSYHYEIETYKYGSYLYNYKCIDNSNSSSISDFGMNIRNHLILPFDIFYGCTPSCNINSCFANSQFEGILPDKLLNGTEINEYSNAKIENTFKNLLIIPNKVNNPNTANLSDDNQYKYNFNILDQNGNTLGLYANDNFVRRSNIDFSNLDPVLDKSGKHMNTYVFVPSEFTKITNLNYAFNFKILLPNSPRINSEISVQEAYAIFKYDSLGKYNNNTFTNVIGLIKSFKNPLPNLDGTQNIVENMNSSENIDMFYAYEYYNLLYFMMLPDVTKIKITINNTEYNEERTFGLNRNHLGFTYEQSNTLKVALQNNGETVFNSNLSMFLYGYFINVFSNDNFINFDFNKLDIENEITLYSPIITISGTPLYYYFEVYHLPLHIGYSGLSKFAVLPNILNNDGYKYVINFATGKIERPKLSRLNASSGVFSNYKALYSDYFVEI